MKKKIGIILILTFALGFIMGTLFNSKKENLNNIIDNKDKIDIKATNKDNNIQNDINSIKLGEAITIDNLIEFTITEGNFQEEIFPSNKSEECLYYEDKPNEIYYVLKGTIKNLSGNRMICDYTAKNFIFNNKYNYDIVTFRVEDNSKIKFDNSVKPLASQTICIFASVPYEIKDNFSKCEFKLGFDEMTNPIKNFDECKNKYSLIIE